MASGARAAVGLLLSGGLDSAILLAWLLDQGRDVQPFYVRGGLAWEPQEQAAAKGFFQAVATASNRSLVLLDLPLADLYGRHWSIQGNHVPDAHSPDEAVYLPGRNALLMIKPAIWCQLHDIGQLALASLGGNPFADATDEFFAAFQQALRQAGGRSLDIIRPFAGLAKHEVMRLGRRFPLELTFSCIGPVQGKHCGQCNKCEERRRAFLAIGLSDPTCYVHAPVEK